MHQEEEKKQPIVIKNGGSLLLAKVRSDIANGAIFNAEMKVPRQVPHKVCVYPALVLMLFHEVVVLVISAFRVTRW
jgi:hypothetical protein